MFLELSTKKRPKSASQSVVLDVVRLGKERTVTLR